jgi:hypothetical protein
MVTKILGRPLSNTAPAIGQVLKWNGTEWIPSNESGGNATTYTAIGGIQLNGTTFSALHETPIWNASKLVGRDMMTTQPAVGQVLKWGGGAWYPANDSVATGVINNTGGPSTTVSKPSVIYFNQTSSIGLGNPNINTLFLPGLDNQSFTLAHNSRIVFHTVIFAMLNEANLFTGNMAVWAIIDILNSNNVMVARATSEANLTQRFGQSMVSAGIGTLPAGTYHTQVTLNRGPGAPSIHTYINGTMGLSPTITRQGGQMIIEIFPD